MGSWIEDKVVIVTGAAGGIGRATVAALLARGTAVGAVGRHPDTESRLADLREQWPTRLECFVGDVGDPDVMRSCVADVNERWGRLDGLFNNAAIQGPIAQITEYSDKDRDDVMRTNFAGVWNGIAAAIPLLKAAGTGGAIVSTASTGGIRGWPGISAYIASKHAVVGLCKTVALECADAGIRVNVLCPGPTDTPLLDSFVDGDLPDGREAVTKALARTVPVGRIGLGDEVAAVATWLLLDAPPYLTGAVLTVDGAQTAGVGQYA